MSAKRTMDIAVSALLLLVLAPIMLALGALVRLTSPGPALDAQDRVGRDGQTFRLWKFRSMVVDADLHGDGLHHGSEVDGPAFTMGGDPRITPLGRMLRRFSLDELPQLLNVLTGSMSLVGPRPPLPAEVAAYTDHHRLRLLVKPGLTCIWQVSGRPEVGFDQWVEMDLEYIRTWSLRLDLVLLLRTLPAVVGGRGSW